MSDRPYYCDRVQGATEDTCSCTRTTGCSYLAVPRHRERTTMREHIHQQLLTLSQRTERIEEQLRILNQRLRRRE